MKNGFEAGKINLYKKETLGFAIITRKVGRKTTTCVSPTGMYSQANRHSELVRYIYQLKLQ